MLFFDKLISEIEEDASGLYIYVNPYSYGVLRRSATDFKNVSGVFVDGISLVWLLRLLGIRVSRRSFDMTSMAPVVFSHAASRGLSLCLVGSAENDVLLTSKKILSQFDGLRLTIVRDGYFTGLERDLFLQRLVDEAPDVVIVGMGSPLQEKFLIDLWGQGWRGLGFTCGGFIHQTASSNNITYYPPWVDRLNLRWLYRMIDEPKIIKRYLVDYPINVFYLLKDFIVYRLVLRGDFEK